MEKSRVQIKQSTTPIPSLPWETIWSSQLFRIHGPLLSGPVVLKSMVPGPRSMSCWGSTPDLLCLNKPSKGFWCKLKFENHCFNICNSLKAHFCSCWWPKPWLCKFSRFYQNL